MYRQITKNQDYIPSNLIKDISMFDSHTILGPEDPERFIRMKGVSTCMALALYFPEEGIIAILEGMKIRPDRSEILKNTDLSFMLILGKKDNYIQYDIVRKKIQLPQNSELLILKNSGHMGFIEEKKVALNEIISFIDRCWNL